MTRAGREAATKDAGASEPEASEVEISEAEIELEATPVVESFELSEQDARAEALFLGLRLLRGLDLRELESRFGVDLRLEHADDLARLSEAGLIEFNDNLLRLTRTGALLSNEVFATFV